MVLIDLLKAFDILCYLSFLNKLTRLGTLNKALSFYGSKVTSLTDFNPPRTAGLKFRSRALRLLDE